MGYDTALSEILISSCQQWYHFGKLDGGLCTGYLSYLLLKVHYLFPFKSPFKPLFIMVKLGALLNNHDFVWTAIYLSIFMWVLLYSLAVSFLVAWSVIAVILLWFAAGVSTAADNVLYKLNLFLVGALHMGLSSDKRYGKPTDASLLDRTKPVRSKRLIFIRHAESEWNEVFNRGFGASFFVRLGNAILKEAMMMPTRNSLFVDSPLSDLGAKQVDSLIEFLDQPFVEVDPIEKQILQGDSSEPSLIVNSNLRRAISTCTLGLKKRLQKTNEKVKIMSSLQEISRNIDAMAIAGPNEIPDLNDLPQRAWRGFSADSLYETELNDGNKSLTSNGLRRMLEFADWVFTRDEPTIVVGGGHSLWFREFFRSFLPRDVDHVSKQKKMRNCSVISLKFLTGVSKVDSSPVFCIEQDSIVPVFSNFEGC